MAGAEVNVPRIKTISQEDTKIGEFGMESLVRLSTPTLHGPCLGNADIDGSVGGYIAGPFHTLENSLQSWISDQQMLIKNG